MDDRTRQMIDAYIPGEPDPELNEGEYYYRQSTMGGERIIKVYPLDILPIKSGSEYGIYQKVGSRLKWVDVGYGDHNRGCQFWELDDNKTDCKNMTHIGVDEWEHLRKIQQEEQNERI